MSADEPLNPADDDVLRRSAAGDGSAFEQFVTRHEAWLLRYARAIGGPDAAEELLQDTFIAAWRGAASFSGGASAGARPWLMAIARNAHKRTFRHRVGEPAGHESLESIESLARAGGWGSEGPEAEIDRLVQRRALSLALDRLPPDEREALVLRDLEGWTGDETARRLGISLAALKSRLHRARLRLVAGVKELQND